jgi:excisionase family DNA binding protein
LTVKEAAEAVQLQPGTIYEKTRRGELRAVRLGEGPCARLRIPRMELALYLRAHSPAATLADVDIDAELDRLRGELRKAAPGH